MCESFLLTKSPEKCKTCTGKIILPHFLHVNLSRILVSIHVYIGWLHLQIFLGLSVESKGEGEGIVVSHVEEGRLAHVQGTVC